MKSKLTPSQILGEKKPYCIQFADKTVVLILEGQKGFVIKEPPAIILKNPPAIIKIRILDPLDTIDKIGVSIISKQEPQKSGPEKSN